MTIITQDKKIINYDNVIKIYSSEETDNNNKPIYYLMANLSNSDIFDTIIGEFKTKEELDAAKVKILSKIQDKVFI